MPIQILPPQLANQIAAGEVVERPSSVVKELVENSLDAGANQIQIDIEKGGAQLIRIRDNGIGIPKQELSLALARHATSKISCLDDLESILSLGFRGEALASISAVSRLTLTSRTAEQNEAWQVYAQGRDMETTIIPASHPVGTTVEVANLFFNTPARRKFLRTDKTEFSHIDEVIRRIALAKPNIAFTLTHNGKIIRQYKSAVDNSQNLKRIAAICGQDFLENSLYIDWKHDNLHLSGWVALPQFNRSQNDLAYSYVNGRMVRDKIITHAIRQAYNEYLHSEQFPAFVLFIDLNPIEVDVNVHPTKHEVRFHQSRLVHDFIYQGILNALKSEKQLPFIENIPSNQIKEPQPLWTHSVKPNRAAAGKNIFMPEHFGSRDETKTEKLSNYRPHFETEKIHKTAVKSYTQLLAPTYNSNEKTAPASLLAVKNSSVLQVLTLIEQKALLVQKDQKVYLLPIKQLQMLYCQLNLQPKFHSLQPLLIPLVFRLTEQQIQKWQQYQVYFQQMGFDFTENLTQKRITLNQVPTCLRQQNLQHLIISLLSQTYTNYVEFRDFICQQLQVEPITELAQGITLLTQTEKMLPQQTELQLDNILISIDFTPYLN